MPANLDRLVDDLGRAVEAVEQTVVGLGTAFGGVQQGSDGKAAAAVHDRCDPRDEGESLLYGRVSKGSNGKNRAVRWADRCARSRTHARTERDNRNSSARSDVFVRGIHDRCLSSFQCARPKNRPNCRGEGRFFVLTSATGRESLV
jgi:hypothetical protein